MWLMHWTIITHWLWVHTGTGNEPGSYYGFWSGFGSDIGEATIVVAITTSLAHAMRARNCEVHRCWRIGKHTTAAGHKVCRKHHPAGAPSAQDVVDAHAAALDVQQ